MSTFDPNAICKQLGLVPHPEGGYYRETYRSKFSVPLSKNDSSQRAASTAIYYMLTGDSFSELHSLKSDEIFHFYLGDTVEMLLLYQDGKGEVTLLGQNLAQGENVQVVVEAGVIFGCRIKDGGNFALMGTTVAPGFDFADYIKEDRAELVNRFPQHEKMIISLTRTTNNE